MNQSQIDSIKRNPRTDARHIEEEDKIIVLVKKNNVLDYNCGIDPFFVIDHQSIVNADIEGMKRELHRYLLIYEDHYEQFGVWISGSFVLK